MSNTIIKKKFKNKEKEKEKELLDDLLNELQAEQSKEEEESKPIQITDEVKQKMMKFMDSYLANKAKLKKVNAIKKELTTQSATNLKDLETLMKFYGLTELIKGENQFILDQTTKKKALKKNEFKEVISSVLNDPVQLEKIYSAANECAEEVVVEKLKCLKYKGN